MTITVTPLCSTSGKRRFSRREAMAEARWWKRTRLARMRHYRCRSCGDWHIGNDHHKPRTRR